MSLHHLEFLRRELALLEQNGVRDSDLADIVQWRGLIKQGYDFFGEEVAEPVMFLEGHGQQGNVLLGTAYMVAGLVIASLGQAGHCNQCCILGAHQFLRTFLDQLLKLLVLVFEQLAGAAQGEMGTDACQNDQRRDWFGDVVDRAEIESDLLITHLVPGSEEYYRNIYGIRVGFEPLAGLVAVERGHYDVEQDKVWTQTRLNDFERSQA